MVEHKPYPHVHWPKPPFVGPHTVAPPLIKSVDQTPSSVPTKAKVLPPGYKAIQRIGISGKLPSMLVQDAPAIH